MISPVVSSEFPGPQGARGNAHFSSKYIFFQPKCSCDEIPAAQFDPLQVKIPFHCHRYVCLHIIKAILYLALICDYCLLLTNVAF